MATRVATDTEVDARIKRVDDHTNRLLKLITEQGKLREILVPTLHLRQYFVLLERLRFLERHLSNLVMTYAGEDITDGK